MGLKVFTADEVKQRRDARDILLREVWQLSSRYSAAVAIAALKDAVREIEIAHIRNEYQQRSLTPCQQTSKL